MKRTCTVQNSLLIGLLVLLLTGCAASPRSLESRQSLAFKYATGKVLQGQEDRAIALRDWIGDARTYIAASDTVTISTLAQELRRRIPWDRFDNADTQLIRGVILEARERLEAELGKGSLNVPGEVKLLSVLAWIEAATWNL